MYPRTNYEMTEIDMKELMEAMQPVPVMKIGNYAPPSVQVNANRAWERLGKKMGFDYETVQPRQGYGTRFFTAIPSETPEQKIERETAAAEENRQLRITELKMSIERQTRDLKALEDGQPNAE